ncbi:hypothetical protein N5J48_12475 [Acinetobacter ursingii]|uniref:hypothetical protein n=1 Tax=Acinetobacter ursingii TaxID=108980 RepID=UPI0024471B17|nr:hypothetical protein [Acinetobacter ursingii]MDH0008359.1 hypothetical protein [Acinetobacter ursingii]MDH0480189.1 hypothetical protein [Acinetobacter ursingii]MDH2120797.1 hypothetical protein [Acinetobacter ursingii]MDH2128367.1 hypothetical protein [Acinetobacter ursingii]
MNNYKIPVNNEAESREARDLFHDLGFSLDSSKYEKYVAWVVVFEDGSGSFYSSDTNLEECQELTLPQLRDLAVKHRKQNGLISGADALRALADGEDVLWKANSESIADAKRFIEHPPYLALALDPNCDYQFWIKPRTISINGIEVPAPFEPKNGDWYFFLVAENVCGYSTDKFEGVERDFYQIQFGAWRTEEEIKQVAAALRKVFEVQA